MSIRPAAAVWVSAIVVLFSSGGFIATAADVSGTLEINKKEFSLSYGYMDLRKPEEPIITLSDKPLPPEQIRFLEPYYTLKEKVHALLFGVIRKDKKLSSGVKWVYFGGDAGIPFSVFNKDKVSLDLAEADDAFVEGKINTIQPVKLTDLTYSFDASIKVSTKTAFAKASIPKKVSFSGDNSAPVKAYKEYYKAIMAGSFEGVKKYLVAKDLRELEAMDSKELDMMLDDMGMRPEQVRINKPSITRDQAVFKVSGKEGSTVFTGSIKMVIENGTWKVLEDKWESASQ